MHAQIESLMQYSIVVKFSEMNSYVNIKIVNVRYMFLNAILLHIKMYIIEVRKYPVHC